MTVESATYISDLNASYPAAGDAKSEGDNHLRLLKTTVKATFPNVTGAVTPTHTELNYVDGVTSPIQTQIDNIVAGTIPARVITNLTTNTTLTSNQDYSYNTAGLTLTLPASPSNGDRITIINMGTNVDCVIGRNGKNIMGSEADMTIDLPNTSVSLEHVNSNSQEDWRLA